MAEPAARTRVVIIGDALPGAWRHDDARDPVFVAFDQIRSESFTALRPDLILTPLMDEGFDCFDVAIALRETGYRGRLRAVVRFLPDPALVRREIAAICPGLDFDIIVTGQPGPAPVRGDRDQ